MKPSPAVSLLLTNLRLLDYYGANGDGSDSHSHSHSDPRSDSKSDSGAFPITPAVFTSLTNKGKAFEHIIYHLFHTFDPDECALKLQGCWPVYEPSQARELRNVVFRWLDDLKKSGRLGGVLIRRTTLDDCCGPRYEELLLALSTMVLRDQIEQGKFPDFVPSFAYHQAVSPQPSLHGHLAPLALAHRHALGGLLEARRDSKAKWSAFSALLDAKEAEIAAMAEQLPVAPGAGSADDGPADSQPRRRPAAYHESIRAKWRNNWLGDPRWLDILLDGDPEAGRDQFLDLGFEEAFDSQHRFARGRAAPTAAVSLRGLDNQVAEQRRRVEEIRKLREQSLGSGLSPPKSRTSSPTKSAAAAAAAAAAAGSEQAEARRGPRVEFAKHQSLHLKDMAALPRRSRNRRNEYSELLASLREEMMLASTPSQRAQEKPEVPVYYHYDTAAEQPLGGGDSAPVEEDVDGGGPEVYHLRINLQDGTTGARSDDNGIQNDMSPQPPDTDVDRMDLDDMDTDCDQQQQQQQHQVPPLSYLSANPSPMPKQPEWVSGGGSYPDSSDEEASDLFSSRTTSQAPSNLGRRPSTAATAATTAMVRNPYGFGDELPRREGAPIRQPTPEPPRARGRSSIGFFGDDELYAEQIVSSIASAPFSPDRPSPEKPKSARAFRPPFQQQLSPLGSPMSPYPHEQSAVQMGDSTTVAMAMPLVSPPLRVDEAPGRLAAPARTEQPAAASTTPTEDLLRSGDYNSVFKSRPKIALSPAFSPSPAWDVPAAVVGLNISLAEDAATNDVDDDGDEVMEYISSPLTNKGRM